MLASLNLLDYSDTCYQFVIGTTWMSVLNRSRELLKPHTEVSHAVFPSGENWPVPGLVKQTVLDDAENSSPIRHQNQAVLGVFRPSENRKSKGAKGF